LEGSLTIRGGKAIKASYIKGAVEVDSMQADINLKEITGTALVKNPYGPIDVSSISQTLRIDSDHNEIRARQVSDITIEAPGSKINVDTVKGNANVSAIKGRIIISSVSGSLLVRGENTYVDSSNIRGAIDISTTNATVSVKGFSGSARVSTTLSDVTLVAAADQKDDIVVNNEIGEIKVILPTTANFQVDAMSTNGMIRPVGFSEYVEPTRERLALTVGRGGPMVKLKTTVRPIIIQLGKDSQTGGSKNVSWE
jgi:hypothetical protein